MVRVMDRETDTTDKASSSIQYKYSCNVFFLRDNDADSMRRGTRIF